MEESRMGEQRHPKFYFMCVYSGHRKVNSSWPTGFMHVQLFQSYRTARVMESVVVATCKDFQHAQVHVR